MYRGKRVGVVVPAYNEETQIGRVLETMPDVVDRILVVDDCKLGRDPGPAWTSGARGRAA